MKDWHNVSKGKTNSMVEGHSCKKDNVQINELIFFQQKQSGRINSHEEKIFN